jgi:hypothetical protein
MLKMIILNPNLFYIDFFTLGGNWESLDGLKKQGNK